MRGLLSILVALATLLAAQAAAPGGSTRVAPSQSLPAVAFTLSNQTAFSAAITVHAVEESIPANWTVSTISHSGRFDAAARKIRWGPFFDATPRTLTARVTPAATALGICNFAGVISIDGAEFPIGGAASIFVLGVADANSAARILPATFSPGVAFALAINAQPAANIAGYAVEETIPEGWTASNLSHGGAADGQKLKWGPFFDTTPRQLTCEILPPQNARAVAAFSGVASFDGIEVALTGPAAIAPLLSRITRALPTHYSDSEIIAATLDAAPAPATQIYSVIETLPAGWTPSNINLDGVFDAASRSIRWGPYFDNIARALTYSAQPPAGSLIPVAFSGQGVFDDQTALTSGATGILPRASIVTRLADLSAEVSSNTTLMHRANPRPGVSTYAVEFVVPSGWAISTMSDGASHDAANARIKWGPFFDDAPRDLTATFVVGSQLGAVPLNGSASFDGATIPISGAPEIQIVAPPANPSSVIRALPATLRPGSSFTIAAQATPALAANVYAVEETLPIGWSASNVSDGGAYDERNRIIKWGPFFDATPRLLTARVTSPANATGAIVFSGRASFGENVQPISGAQALAMSLTPNRPPTAANDSFTRHLDAPLTIQISRLLSNDTDPDGDSLTLTAAATSSQGIVIARVGNTLVYSPAAEFNVADSFTYTVADADGATATATVSIQPPAGGATQNIISVTPGPTGAALRFGGIPGFSYDIQFSPILPAVTWTTLIRRTADQTGRFEYFDASAAGQGQRYYRTQFVE